MKRKEDQLYDLLINRLRTDSPELEQPDRLTQSILTRIEEFPPKNRVKIWLLQGWISGATAVILCFVLLLEWQLPLPSGLPSHAFPALSTVIPFQKKTELSFKEEVLLHRNILSERAVVRSQKNTHYAHLLQNLTIHLKSINNENK